MIELGKEELMTLTKATRLVPRRRGERLTHVSTLHRWATRGLRGVRLETVQVGGSKCTSREALDRFFSALSQAASAADDATPPCRPVRAAAMRSALRDLEGLGL